MAAMVEKLVLLFAGPQTVPLYSPCGPQEITAMALMDFIKKQFIDILEWQEDSDGTLAWRFPM